MLEEKVHKIVPIFSGGGTRLTAHIGVLQALKELKLEFSSLVGVSGGSIVAGLYASGLPLPEIKKLALETDFQSFREFSLFRLLREGGLGSGDKLESWLDEHLQGKTFSDIQFSLHIMATDINGGGPVVFNKQNSPNMKISKAIRFSMSIPLIYSFKHHDEHILADGAILSEDALFREWSSDGAENLCFRLKGTQEKGGEFNKGFFPLKSYVLMVIRTFMTAVSREYINNDYWGRTIVIDTGKASGVDFKMSEQDKEELFRAGYFQALSYVPKKLHIWDDKVFEKDLAE